MTGPDGVAKVSVPTGMGATLAVVPPGHRESELADEALPWTPRDQKVALPPAASLRGRVVDGSGTAVPFATVRARSKGGVVTRVVVAGADGSFVMPRVGAGAVAVEADVEDVGGKRLGPATERADTSEAVTISLPGVPRNPNRPARVIRVLGFDGRPVPGANVQFTVHSESGSGNFRSATTKIFGGTVDGASVSYDVEGDATVEVFRARNELGDPLPYGPVRAGPFGAGEFEVRLPAEGAVTGRVVDSTGAPVPHVRVTATSTAADGSNGIFAVMGNALHGATLTDEQGAFRIGGLGRRSYRIESDTRPGLVACQPVKAVSGGAGLEVVLRKGVRPTITVTDSEGRPVAHASVVVRSKAAAKSAPASDEDAPLQGATDDDGVLKLGFLDPERGYRLTVTPPLAEGDALLPFDQTGWRPTDTPVKLHRGLRVRGKVTDPTGKPIPAAVVTWAREGSTKSSQVVADAEGVFAIERLRPGALTLLPAPPKSTSSVPAVVTGVKPTPVQAGAEEVVLTLAMPTRIDVRVPNWKPAHGMPLVLLVEDGPATAAVKKSLDKDGKISLESLRWDVSYALWIGPIGDGLVGCRRAVRSWDGEVVVDLKRGEPVRGKVVAPPGAQSLKVWAVLSNHQIAGKVKPDRTYEIPALPAGTWTIRASATTKSGPLSAEGQVAAGGALDLELRAP